MRQTYYAFIEGMYVQRCVVYNLSMEVPSRMILSTCIFMKCAFNSPRKGISRQTYYPFIKVMFATHVQSFYGSAPIILSILINIHCFGYPIPTASGYITLVSGNHVQFLTAPFTIACFKKLICPALLGN